MHKVLRTDRGDAQVTGVIRDIPEQAHIHYDFLLPMQRDIRKIVGASVTGIVVLLSKDFIRLVALSILIATPLAWFAMDQWLGNFAYRITIQWWIFLVAGAIAVIIALATVSLQTIKAALTNPVKALRSE